MNKERHTLEHLADITAFITSNDIGNKQAEVWEQVHKRVMELPDGSFFDITNIKSSGKGGKLIKEKTSAHTAHESLPLVWTDDASFEVYKKGTGL